jgi:hypothetical protein
MKSDSLIVIAQKISELFGRAFWHSDEPSKCWPVADILQRLPKMQLLILAFDESRHAIGYSMFIHLRWKGGSVLFADSGGVSGGSPRHPEDWQFSGVGSEMLKEALRQLPCETLAARTQNPAIVPMLRKLKPQQILPIDAAYAHGTLELLEMLRAQVPELMDGEIAPSSGIYKSVYKEGLLGDYGSRIQGAQIKQFEETITGLDRTWNREQGDAVILVATGLTHVDNIPEPGLKS